MADLVAVPGEPRPVIDYMARDAAGLLAAMRAAVPDHLPEWTGANDEADFGTVLLELFAQLGDVLSYYQDRVATEAFLGTARTRRSVIDHLALIGYQLTTAAPATALVSVSVTAARTDTVTIRPGDAFATRSTPAAPSVRFEYTRPTPLVIDFNALSVVDGRRTYAGVPVEEGRLFAAEVLGVSDGRPDQRFPLAHPQVIRRPVGAAGQAQDVAVTTTLGAVVTGWTVRDTLAFSTHGETDATLAIDEADRAVLVFGDGVFGAVPPAGAQIAVSYRCGGGTAGNVGTGAIDTIVDAPALALLGAAVTNPAPAAGGADRESIEHAVRHAPGVFRAQDRAVTAADYEALAADFTEVGKVRASTTGWNRVRLLVALSGGRGRVGDALEAKIQGFLEGRRMLGQVVEIADVDYVPILVTAHLEVLPYYVAEDVRAAATRAGAALLAFEAVDFDRPLFLSTFYERLAEVPGVRGLTIDEFRRADRPDSPLEGRILLGPGELPTAPNLPDYPGGLRVDVVTPGG